MTDCFNKYCEEILNYKVLSREEEQELMKRASEGDESARKRLVEANLRLVVKIAHGYKNMGVGIEELVSSGNLGLLEAAGKVKYKEGQKSRFTTYAQTYIRSAIKKSLSENSGALPMSKGTYDRRSKIRKAKDELGESATIDAIRKKSGGHSRKTIERALTRDGKVYLEDTIGNGDDRRYIDVVEEENASTAIDQIVRDERMNAMLDGLDKLDETEKFIIFSLFGFNGGEKMTLTEIGNELGLSAERIRQIKNAILAKLRAGIEA